MSAELGEHALRRLMALWATGVSVLTSHGRDGPRGATANAVASLSLEPPLIIACLNRGSRTLRAVLETRRFAINILAADQEHMSRRFASRDPARFRGVMTETVDGAPVLTDALGWIVCSVREELPGGDHLAIVGAPVRGAAREDGEPLIFFRSRYRSLAGAAAGS